MLFTAVSDTIISPEKIIFNNYIFDCKGITKTIQKEQWGSTVVSDNINIMKTTFLFRF